MTDLIERVEDAPTADVGLKPCPWCGGEASAAGSVRYSKGHEAWWPDGTQVRDAYFCNCMKCGCDNRATFGHQTPALAIAAWNRRPASPDLGEVVEVLRALIDRDLNYNSIAVNARAEALIARLESGS